MLIFLPIMLSSNSQQIATCIILNALPIILTCLVSKVGIKCIMSNKSTIAKSIYDTVVVNYNTAAHVASCNPHI